MNDTSLYPQFRLLLVDDDAAWLRSLRLTLAYSAGITNVEVCDKSAEVMGIIADGEKPGAAPIGLVLLDLTMPEPDGEELLRRISEQYPGIPVIIISGMNQLSTAVQCIKRGAFDYFVKTDPQEYLLKGINQAIRSLDLQRVNQEMRRHMLSGELRRPEVFSGFITVSPLMLSVFQYLESVAASSQPVLISGESGVGKELLAHAVHELSGRKGQLVTLNVAGIDDSVFSDTLFGHSAGAFTGAAKPRRGLVERAAGGTLFLDEIGDLPQASQIKLLRLLQEGEYYPLGSDLPGHMEARIVAATHHNLKTREAEGLFRRDLYHRMHVHCVHIPPLRERTDDIPVLLRHFTRLAAVEYGKPVPEISPALSERLRRYSFPGNTRELKNMVFDAVGRCRGNTLTPEHVAGFLPRDEAERAADYESRPRSGAAAFLEDIDILPDLKTAHTLLVREALRRTKGNQTLAARMLGISQPAMSKRMRLMRPGQEGAGGTGDGKE